MANSIREDPRKPGLLYAATETQVWVSIDDGDHWQSLRLDMPAVSVRDIQVKDDTTCLCSDLVAGTHGRGFWILDNVTPLRQAGARRRPPRGAFLFKPATAVRVRFGTNDAHGVDAGAARTARTRLPGGIIDYYLAARRQRAGDARDPRRRRRRWSARSRATDPVLDPDPALDPEGYDRICQQRSDRAQLPRAAVLAGAADGALDAAKGMHRFSWDLHFEPLGDEPRAGGGATGAVPGRTYPSVAGAVGTCRANTRCGSPSAAGSTRSRSRSVSTPG